MSSNTERLEISHLREVQHWLSGTHLSGIVVPSTDEFISEFAPPPNRRLRWVTGFRGSTGTAVVLRDSAALFLDGRYLLQGAEDTQGSGIEVLSSQGSARREWMRACLASGSRLGLDPWIHSVLDMNQWQALATELGIRLEMLETNPIDQLWTQGRPARHEPAIVDYPTQYAGEPYESKCVALVEYLRSAKLHALLIADPEDVSWLLNVRAAEDVLKTHVGDFHVVPDCVSRAMVRADGSVTWYVEKDRLAAGVQARGAGHVSIAPPATLVASLREASQHGPIGLDPRRTPAALAAVLESGRMRADHVVAHRRWRKHPAEVQAAKRAHALDAAAVVSFMAWLTRTVGERDVSEFEAAEALESFRSAQPACKGASMPLMCASGVSGAQPHYVPRRERCRRLNDHPIFWMDSGGQYPGGTTDNTITMALRPPERKHVVAHTRVLQGYIALATLRFPQGTHALRLDSIARQALWREGMDFQHSTGHGVGNYLNIHEGPLIGSAPGPTTMVPLEPGMIVSNEPAYYAAGDFGLRIESHMVVIASALPGFLEFETISRLPIDPRLVDSSLLSSGERTWLAQYHQTVLRELAPLLEEAPKRWLQRLVHAFD